MATAALIPVEEYLSTVYRPDRDFVDGELKERNLGEQQHAQLQTIVASFFYRNRKLWSTRALTEQRVQTSSTHYRIADVCILRSSDPVEGIVRRPPLLCIEILSRGDSLAELQERVDDYQAMGVEHVWALDPWKRIGYIASTEGFRRPSGDVFSIPDTPIVLSLGELFAELDDALRPA